MIIVSDVRQLRKMAGMTQKDFALYFGIPKRTVEDWDAGKSKCAEYLLDLMTYKLEKEGVIPKKY